MNVTTYRVCSHFLSALINGDYSGLTDTDIDMLEGFVMSETDNIRNYHWAYNSEFTEDFARCEITKLHSDTVELHLVDMSTHNEETTQCDS